MGAVSVIGDGAGRGENTARYWNKPILNNALVEEWIANVLYSDLFLQIRSMAPVLH